MAVGSLTSSKNGEKPDFAARVLADKFSPLTRDFRAYSSDLSEYECEPWNFWNERKTELEHGLKETLSKELEILERKIFLDNYLSWRFQLSAR